MTSDRIDNGPRLPKLGSPFLLSTILFVCAEAITVALVGKTWHAQSRLNISLCVMPIFLPLPLLSALRAYKRLRSIAQSDPSVQNLVPSAGQALAAVLSFSYAAFLGIVASLLPFVLRH